VTPFEPLGRPSTPYASWPVMLDAFLRSARACPLQEAVFLPRILGRPDRSPCQSNPGSSPLSSPPHSPTLTCKADIRVSNLTADATRMKHRLTSLVSFQSSSPWPPASAIEPFLRFPGSWGIPLRFPLPRPYSRMVTDPSIIQNP